MAINMWKVMMIQKNGCNSAKNVQIQGNTVVLQLQSEVLNPAVDSPIIQ